VNRRTLGRTGLSVSEIGSQWNARWSGCAPTGSTSSTVQIVYNLARREAEDTFLPTAQAANVGVIAREPLANGFLAGRYNADSTWERGDIRSRMPRPYVTQLAALGQRVRELAEKSGMTATQLALKFVLDRGEVASAIVGMKTVRQVEENLNAGM